MKTWRTTTHLPGAQRLGPRPDVGQDVGDRLHLGDRVVELGHARPGRVRVRVDQAGQDRLAAEVDHRGPRPPGLEDLLVGPDPEQPVALDGQGLADREVAVDRDDLAVVEDQVGLVGPPAPAEAERRPARSVNQQESEASSWRRISWSISWTGRDSSGGGPLTPGPDRDRSRPEKSVAIRGSDGRRPIGRPRRHDRPRGIGPSGPSPDGPGSPAGRRDGSPPGRTVRSGLVIPRSGTRARASSVARGPSGSAGIATGSGRCGRLADQVDSFFPTPAGRDRRSPTGGRGPGDAPLGGRRGRRPGRQRGGRFGGSLGSVRVSGRGLGTGRPTDRGRTRSRRRRSGAPY